MKYKHDSMLPIGAFKPQGSVVGGRSMRLYSGDSWSDGIDWDALRQAEEEAANRQMELEHATRLAAQGYPRALDDIRAQDAWNAAQAQQEQQAAQQAAAQAQAWSNQVTNEAAQAAAQQRADELNAIAQQQASQSAINQRQTAAEQAAVNAAIQNKTEYVSPGNVEEIRQANLVKDIPFGVGMGQALGYSYELLNADGEPYQRYDAKGNLTQFVDRLTGKWANVSDVKPVGSTFDQMANKFITEYEYGGRKYTPYEGSGGLAKAAFMDPYSKDTGGFLGQGGWANMAALVAAGFAPYALPALASAGLGAAGAAGLYGGLTSVGKGLLSGKSFEDSLVEGLKSGAISAVTAGILSGLSPEAASSLDANASEEGIGKFLDSIKESGGQFTGDTSGVGGDMSFDDLVSATGATQPTGDIFSGTDPLDFLDAAQQIYSGKGTEENIKLFNKIIGNLPPGYIKGPDQPVPPGFIGSPEQPFPPGSIGGPNQPFPPSIIRPIGPGGGGGGGGGGIGGGGASDTEEDQDDESKKKDLSAALLAQIQPITVKPPPVAEIDYMYDIGGDSIFATPKQESLMPSPFEANPEAVEGAMPRYQYYDPKGGYQYADGGIVAFDDGGEVTQEELEAAARPMTYNPKLAAYGEQRRESRPEKEMTPEELMLAEVAAGFHPVIGPVLSAKDFEEARGEDNYLGMGLAALGMIPVVGGAIKGYNRIVKPILRDREIEQRMVREYGKIPKGQPIPEGYYGGPTPKEPKLTDPSEIARLADPRFQTDYAKEFTHNLYHSSKSPDIQSFNPSANRNLETTLSPSGRLDYDLGGSHSNLDATTFLSSSAEHSAKNYLPTTLPTDSLHPVGVGFPDKTTYATGATMYPVSARLGKVFDFDAPEAAKVVDSFIDSLKDIKKSDANAIKSRILDGNYEVIESPAFRDFLKQNGYDSFSFGKAGQDIKNYGIFDPSRIRGKYAEFNPEHAASTDIMKAEGGLIGSDDYTIDDLYELLRGK